MIFPFPRSGFTLITILGLSLDIEDLVYLLLWAFFGVATPLSLIYCRLSTTVCVTFFRRLLQESVSAAKLSAEHRRYLCIAALQGNFNMNSFWWENDSRHTSCSGSISHFGEVSLHLHENKGVPLTLAFDCNAVSPCQINRGRKY